MNEFLDDENERPSDGAMSAGDDLRDPAVDETVVDSSAPVEPVEKVSPVDETVDPVLAGAAATGASAAAVTSSSGDKKRPFWMWLVAGVVALGLILGGFLFFGKDKDKSPENNSQPAVALPKGAVITIPDNLDGGLPNKEYEKARKAEATKFDKEKAKKDAAKKSDENKVKTKEAPQPKYADPTNLEKYRVVQDDGTVVLKAPVDGKCAVSTRGGILPPQNYMHVCHYEQNGAVFYTSHAVVGPRVGALENIQYLKKGQVVTLEGVDYIVSDILVFPANKLPEYLFQPGIVALVTCHIDASVKTYNDFTKTDIVLLKRK